MEKLTAESFIREHVRKILLEKDEEETPKDDPSREAPTKGEPQGPGQVFGSAGRGRLPQEIADIFGGEGGSAAEVKRLATVNPGKLMSNLGVTRQQGDTTLERAKAVIASARASTPVFKQAIGPGQDVTSGERNGVFFSNEGLPNDRLANLFIYDTVRAAAAVGFIKMTGHLRVEPAEGGVLVYNVRNSSETWED